MVTKPMHHKNETTRDFVVKREDYDCLPFHDQAPKAPREEHQDPKAPSGDLGKRQELLGFSPTCPDLAYSCVALKCRAFSEIRVCSCGMP